MEKSETISKLTAALCQFQGKVSNPLNTAKNPFFKSKYAPLSEVVNTIKPVLMEFGLSFIQNTNGNGDGVTVSTILFHSSGEWIKSGELTAKPEKATAQAMGAVITYLRRYQLSAIIGISSEDDIDGNDSVQQKTVAPPAPVTPQPLAADRFQNAISKLESEDFTILAALKKFALSKEQLEKIETICLDLLKTYAFEIEEQGMLRIENICKYYAFTSEHLATANLNFENNEFKIIE